MNIAIVGAGISGISTALELARDGHQVTVYEQLNAAAEGASFAPGGWLSPCELQILAAPGLGMPLHQLRKHDNLRLTSPAFWGNRSWRWLRTWKRAERQHLKQPHPVAHPLTALAHYSQSLRWQHCDDPSTHAERKIGNLLLIRSHKQMEASKTHLAAMQALGHTCNLLTSAQARFLEPGLGADLTIAGAINFSNGESINTRLWTQHLRHQAHLLGVSLHTGTCVDRINPHPCSLQVQGHNHTYDRIIICTGAAAELLHNAAPLPTQTIWGYSVTAPVRDALHAPRNAILDWEHQMCITRIGQRVRITGGAELGSAADTPHHPPTLQRMYTHLNDCFPGGAHLSSPQVQVWRGARHTLPDGLPAIGASAYPHIWLNLAHGCHGAALAAGSARAIADMAQDRTPAIDMQAFAPLRFNT